MGNCIISKANINKLATNTWSNPRYYSIKLLIDILLTKKEFAAIYDSYKTSIPLFMIMTHYVVGNMFTDANITTPMYRNFITRLGTLRKDKEIILDDTESNCDIIHGECDQTLSCCLKNNLLNFRKNIKYLGSLYSSLYMIPLLFTIYNKKKIDANMLTIYIHNILRSTIMLSLFVLTFNTLQVLLGKYTDLTKETQKSLLFVSSGCIIMETKSRIKLINKLMITLYIDTLIHYAAPHISKTTHMWRCIFFALLSLNIYRKGLRALSSLI